MIGKVNDILDYILHNVPEDSDQLFELKEIKEKRTLTQNSYCWKLIVLLADKLSSSKEQVYLQMLKDYGQSDIISVRADVNIGSYVKYYEQIGMGEIKGKIFTHYKVYKGSSEYNTREMSIFIDGIIQECEQVGIPTMTKEEIERLSI